MSTNVPEVVKNAFIKTCQGYSVTLPKLLAETRKRGLTDSQVKAVLQDAESDTDNPQYRAWRSGIGELYIECQEGYDEAVASINELFAALDQPSDDGDLSSDDTSPEEPEVEVSSEPVATSGKAKKPLRERAQSLAFRSKQLAKAASDENGYDADCSIPAAMVLYVFRERGCIDQVEMKDLATGCNKAGLTRKEFQCALGELTALMAVDFYYDPNNHRYYGKTLQPMCRQQMCTVQGAVLSLERKDWSSESAQ